MASFYLFLKRNKVIKSLLSNIDYRLIVYICEKEIIKKKKENRLGLTPTQESSRVRRLSLRIADPRPRDVQDVDHRVESFAGVSPSTVDDGLSVTQPTVVGVASLKQGLSKAYASSTISGSVTSTRCLPTVISVPVSIDSSEIRWLF